MSTPETKKRKAPVQRDFEARKRLVDKSVSYRPTTPQWTIGPPPREGQQKPLGPSHTFPDKFSMPSTPDNLGPGSYAIKLPKSASSICLKFSPCPRFQPDFSRQIPGPYGAIPVKDHVNGTVIGGESERFKVDWASVKADEAPYDYLLERIKVHARWTKRLGKKQEAKRRLVRKIQAAEVSREQGLKRKEAQKDYEQMCRAEMHQVLPAKNPLLTIEYSVKSGSASFPPLVFEEKERRYGSPTRRRVPTPIGSVVAKDISRKPALMLPKRFLARFAKYGKPK